MTLPYDIARCQGRMATCTTPGAATLSISTGHVECIQCQRRTSPGRVEYQVYIAPPTFVRGHCPERIATTQPAQTSAGFFSSRT